MARRSANLSKSPDQQVVPVVTRILVCISRILSHGAALSTHQYPVSTIFLENLTTILDRNCATLPAPMKQRRTFAQYLNQVMLDSGERPKDVEDRSKRKGDPISDATVNNILLEKVKNPGILTLRALAKGLGRPIEEVVNAALHDLPLEEHAYQESDFANLWDIYKDLPNGEQKVFKRYLQMLQREMLKH